MGGQSILVAMPVENISLMRTSGADSPSQAMPGPTGCARRRQVSLGNLAVLSILDTDDPTPRWSLSMRGTNCCRTESSPWPSIYHASYKFMNALRDEHVTRLISRNEERRPCRCPTYVTVYHECRWVTSHGSCAILQSGSFARRVWANAVLIGRGPLMGVG